MKLKVNAVTEDLKEALPTIAVVNKLKGVNALDLVGYRSTAYTVLLYSIHNLNCTLLCSHGTTLWGVSCCLKKFEIVNESIKLYVFFWFVSSFVRNIIRRRSSATMRQLEGDYEL